MDIDRALADGYDLQTALHMTLRENQEAIDGMRRQAYTTARAKADFKAKRAEGILHYTSTKSVAATNMKEVVDGTIANDALFDSELAEMMWDVCKEETMLRKREVDVIREEIARMHVEAGRAYQ